MNKLLILGNGFDLAHNMRTNIEDFIESDNTFSDKFSNLKNKSNEWNDVENGIFKTVCEILNSNELSENIRSIVDEIIGTYGINNYGQLDYHVTGSETFHKGLKSMKEFESEIEDFTYEFFQYLKKMYDDDKLLTSVLRNDKMEYFLRSFDQILTFNYTNVVEKLYGCNNVTHIHGNINGEILIGYQPVKNLDDLSISDPTYVRFDEFEKSKSGFQDMLRYYDYGEDDKLIARSDIESLQNIIANDAEKNLSYYQGLIKSHIKQSNPNRQSILNEFEIHNYEEIHIFGHSLGDADYDVFKSIPETTKVICYYYDEKAKTELIEQANRIGLICEMRKTDTIK